MERSLHWLMRFSARSETVSIFARICVLLREQSPFKKRSTVHDFSPPEHRAKMPVATGDRRLLDPFIDIWRNFNKTG
jgi:hypothetical protein